MDFRSHWNNIYKTKSTEQVSWSQAVPHTSLSFIRSFNLPKDAAIIDIGAGESNLVDYLLNEGFLNITLLDISEEAINKAQKRLGDKATKIKWIVSDVNEFNPSTKYDLWHDRATFHFFTDSESVRRYANLAANALNHEGFMTIGTFSTQGPSTCSGLEVKQYNEIEMERTLKYSFKKIRCVTEDHITPFDTVQNFLFCSFKRVA